MLLMSKACKPVKLPIAIGTGPRKFAFAKFLLKTNTKLLKLKENLACFWKCPEVDLELFLYCIKLYSTMEKEMEQYYWNMYKT